MVLVFLRSFGRFAGSKYRFAKSFTPAMANPH